ncbi:NAD(P)H-hydrate dehydratase [Aquifex pyrophilus]
MKVLKAEEMARIDRITIEEIGIPSLVLMENAGRGVYEEIIKHFPDVRRVLIVAGKGNNGGDGIVAGRHLFLKGYEVYIFPVFGEIKGDAKVQLDIARRLGIKVLKEKPDFGRYDLIIDGIFGTGFKPPVKGIAEEIIREINGSGAKVVSVDIPSGLSADTGEVFEPSVRANLTITFQFPKVCHVLFPSAKLCGKVVVKDISIPEFLAKDIKRNLLLEKDLKLYRREEDTYKTREGHVLIVGGSAGKTGAVVMSAKAATRTGAGLVSVGIPEGLNPIVESLIIEEMSIPLKGKERLSVFSVKQILELQDRHHILALGMGMDRYEEGQDIVITLLERWEKPLLLDADGINNLADYGDYTPLKERKVPAVLTPHIGEFSRLMGYDTKTITYNQIDLASEFAINNNCYVVLKGGRTVIATPSGNAYVFTEGTPALAKGGTGDVLSGVLSALIPKMETLYALKLGVFLHGVTGRIAERKFHRESVKALDVVECIPEAYRELEAKIN